MKTTVYSARHAYPEREGFTIDRKNGHPQYTFLHFFNPVEIETGGKREKTFRHACVIYTPSEPQYFRSEVPLVHDWMHFFCEEEYLSSFGVPLNEVFYPAGTDFITARIKRIEYELYSSAWGGEIVVNSEFAELFVDLRRACSEKKADPVNRETEERFSYLRRKFFSEPSKYGTIAEMANEAGLSPSRFFTVYRSVFGTSPINDLIAARIEAAKNLLLAGDDKIESIAYFLGYENAAHFIRQFKKAVGVPPGEYRKAGIAERRRD